jgi:hypothetical protein
LLGRAHFTHVGTQSPQQGDVLAHIALQGEHSDGRESFTSHAQTGGAVPEDLPR